MAKIGGSVKIKRVAITGGVASGKSSVCQFFRELGAYVVNADALAHELLSLETSLGQKILKIFGPQILKNGKIDRRMLAARVFNDPQQLEVLEKLLHPAVLQKIEELYEQAKKKPKTTLFVVEIPLLYEIRAEDAYDAVIVVVADPKTSQERFLRAGFSCDEYEKRTQRQWPIEEKIKRGRYILFNNSSLDHLRQEVVKLNSILKEN